MYRNKKDVDKYVEKLGNKLTEKEFKARAFSVARLYFDVGDYANCQKYVEQYLTQKDNNAAAFRLLGQALQKLDQKDKALDHYKTSLDIDPTQKSTILDICELLADPDVTIEPALAQHWCKKAEDIFPSHPITFRLREKILTLSNPDPESLVKLLMRELAVRPRDSMLHTRLLKHYLNNNKLREAFEHSCNVEFSNNNFINDFDWYDTLDELLKHHVEKDNWQYQLILLTVKERLCVLSLTETPSGPSKSLVETNELLHAYDQALETIAKSGSPSGFAEFHASLLQHHRGQLAFHAATFILKKAKKDQLSWRDANKVASPLMLIAWHTVPMDSKVNWLKHSSEKLLIAVNRWYMEGTYRCSQSGHFILSNFKDKNQSFIDQISQCCSGTHWRDKLYEKIFTNRNHLAKIKTSYFVSNAFNAPVLRLPRKIEVEAYDGDAQKLYGNSLHHFVWTLMNYTNFAHFKCALFDTLTPTLSSCGPETLNKLDMHAFLYCAALTAKQQKSKASSYMASEKPNILPANITDLLCPLPQMKWWDCAYKFSQNLLGTELTDIRVTLSRGIEVVRCVDNHGLDPELLCLLGRIFSERAKTTTSVEEKSFLEMRAGLYYRSAIPLLDKLKSKLMVKVSDRRMFDYTHKELGIRELNTFIEESKLYVAITHLNDCEYDKAIEVLSNVKSAQAYYHLAHTYKKIALEEINSSVDESKSKYASLLVKAKNYAYKALDIFKDSDSNKSSPLYNEIQEIIEDIEVQINRIEPELSVNDIECKYSSDENVSYRSEPMRTNKQLFKNISSTPKATSQNANNTNYKSAIDSQMFEMTRMDQKHLDRIENEIKNLQKRDSAISDYMAQTRDLFEENRKLSNQIMSTINSNCQSTTDQFKLLKISVDHVKDQIDECRTECKDVGDLKKQIAELKKEVNKLKKSSSEQAINESDLYNLDDDYRTNENSSNYAAQLPFPPHMLPQFNQRAPFPVPPNPYQLYNQSLFNLYNQYSQFAQTSSVPGAPPLFDPARAQMNYAGVYQTPDQMYLDVAHLIPPTVPVPPVPSVSTLPTMPVAPTLPTVPTMPSISVPTLPTTKTTSITPKSSIYSENKEITRSLPVNVVITSSDPLPTCVSAPTPVLSVTIPPKHIKGGIPHNYQIAMPTVDETKMVSPPVFSFSMPDNKVHSSTTPNWKQTFKSFTADDSSLDNSKTVVDGPFSGASPNTSLNKSRTLSEKSNTSVENYDPCPDFKPIVPLPAEIKVTTGEENETAIFAARAKLFRFVEKQWKERGIGEMKLLKHKDSGKVRVLMRREQVHKICANHIITSDMEIQPMKNEPKAYFWVANDFADENLVLEKFCIRFKTADIAKDFYDAFEKSRLTSNSTPTSTPKNNSKTQSQKLILNEAKLAIQPTSSENKTVVGGFTFSSTPIFKSVENDSKSTQMTSSTETKTNVFSGLAFKSNSNNTPFNNIFSTAPTAVASPSTASVNQENKSKLNTSDTVEEFEPNVEFKPVIPLPALVDTKTGEEDENALFEHRAKLLRFDSNTKEWKERGLGNIKLLAHKDNNQRIRLLMRREQIMKVCCNHAVTKEMKFQKMPNMDKAVTWGAKDFSEGELVAETFCLRFKTVKVCDDFIEAISSVQSKLKDDTKAAKEEQNAAKQVSNSGFGDKFKAKPGSWYCKSCYTNNLESFTRCACCDQPKPQLAMTPDSTTKSDNNTNKTTTSSSWGDKFKPKPGSWECQACCVRNEASLDNCTACNSPKDPSAPKAVKNVVTEPKSKFSFGIPSQTAESIMIPTNNKSTSESTAPVTSSGFGDKFKPKEGSWECKQCFVRNDGKADTCVACNSSKDPNAPKKPTNIFDNSTSAVKFRFGVPPAPVTEEKPKTETASIFDGTGAHQFTFGIPSITTIKTETSIEPKSTGVIFAAPKMTSESQRPLNFSLKKEENKPATGTRPALLPTPQAEPNSFADKESGTFDFVFNPAKPAKSPAKSPNKSHGDESEGEDYVKDEDCHAYFSPVIPMPDRVEVLTGEEKECELYAHRARLYRFVSGEWKERGTGVVKVLKHKETMKLRVVMRREQVLKICLNHALTPDIIYTPKDEKTWLFVANDFSEGELSLHKFCIRFQNKDIAVQFKEAVDNARQGKPIPEYESKTRPNDNDNDDIIFVSEVQATEEEKKKARDLMLPENFFAYKNKDPCQGCRGCKEDNEKKPEESSTEAIKAVLSAPAISSSSAVMSTAVTTPMKSTFPMFQTPTNSIYGTPVSLEKTFDTSIFRTPLGSIGANTKTSTPGSNNSDATGNVISDKENVFAQKSNIFSNFGQQKSIFSSATSSPATSSPAALFGEAVTQSDTNSNTSIIAPPKLSTAEKQTTDAKSVFASAHSKSAFGSPMGTGEATSIFSNTGTSTNKSIFGFHVDKPKQDTNTEVKSIFGGNDQKGNIFSGAAGSLFGPGSLGNKTQPSLTFGSQSSSIFGTGPSQNNVFTSAFSGETKNPTSIWGTNNEQKKPDEAVVSSEQKPQETKQEETTGIPLKLDGSLSFASLSTSGPGFAAQKKADFQWEGAGQQLFKAGQKAGNDEKNDSEVADETGGGDEEYDPHYEPIVPLPDKIIVTTGEEDEVKVFGERCKLYRYDDKVPEWKERGVGELKILHHPQRNTYRLLLRREQVHKAVLNTLIFMELELRPMTNSDRAWTWAARNYAENPAGEQETLAVRFKNVTLADEFRDKVVECTRKLQAEAAREIREQQEAKDKPSSADAVAPLRLPKHLAATARADPFLSAAATATVASPPSNGTTQDSPDSKQVHFQQEEVYKEEEYEDYEHDEYDEEHDYDGYDYNEDEDENATYYSCDGEAVVRQGSEENTCPQAHIQVLFDTEIYSPKIQITDANTGEILADMLIHTDTDFQMNGDSCVWSGTDYTSNEPADKTVTVNFYDSETAMNFYDSCVTSKPATYSSNDPES